MILAIGEEFLNPGGAVHESPDSASKAHGLVVVALRGVSEVLKANKASG